MDNYRTTAIVLAAGQGKRMNCDVHKQYLLINDKPVLYYSLKVFEDSFIDDVVLVVGKGEEEYCRKEIIERYSFTKIRVITEGGKERYHSVANGINAITWKCDFVFVHDGARPFINNEILERAYDTVKDTQACVVGMPVKDTIKIVDEKRFVTSTPPRAFVWQVQTPQVFSYELINYSYNKLIEEEANLLKNNVLITDDAMVIEYFAHKRVKIVEGSYQNIKITTFEDLGIAKSFLS